MVLNDGRKVDLLDPEDKEKDLDNSKDADSALESVLQHVGEMGRYQKFLFFAMLPFGVIFAFVYLGQMFVVATPQRHWCRVPELKHLDMEMRRNFTAPGSGDVWDRCRMYDANWTHVLATMQPPDPSTPTIPCKHGWEFELGDIPYHTVVSERGWVCENASNGPAAQAIFFVGAFFGGLFFGWLADRVGRLPALVGANLIGCIGGVATIFTTGLWDFFFCRFLVGMSYDSCFMLLYILVLEYVGPSHRTWVANLSIAFFFGSGCVILPWIAIWISNWKHFLVATSLPMLIVLTTPCLVPESARWLASRGEISRAVNVLRKFESVNRTHIPQDVMDDFIMSSRQTRNTDESIGALMKSRSLRRMLIYMVVVYMGCSIIFDGLVRMSESLGLNFFITFTLTSATEIPSTSLLVLVFDRWGRRKLTCGPLFIVGFFSLIAAFLPKGIPQVALATSARFFINMAFNAAIQWATELLPTGVRASGSSVVHVSGYIASILSPYIVYSGRLWSPLPLIMLAIIGLISGAIGILLPETMGQPMPQTIADGEALVKDFSIFSKRKAKKEMKERSKSDLKEMISITSMTDTNESCKGLQNGRTDQGKDNKPEKDQQKPLIT